MKINGLCLITIILEETTQKEYMLNSSCVLFQYIISSDCFSV